MLEAPPIPLEHIAHCLREQYGLPVGALEFLPLGADPDALAYYRCERIVEDIGVSCEQIFLSDAGGADRPQSLAYLKSNYEPGGLIEAALR